MSCFCGLRAYGGAQAVGSATQNTVVLSTLTILLSDYFLTSFLPIGFKSLML
jgi:ABC-type transporter Mla maintaining outer membrane lipid asymmetry permease subunit MlaE